YYVVVLTICLALICATFALRPQTTVRLIPWSLLMLAAASSIAPCGASAWSLRSQIARVNTMLAEAGLLDTAGHIPAPAADSIPANVDPESLRSTLQYLERSHSPRVLARWTADDTTTLRDLLERLRLAPDLNLPLGVAHIRAPQPYRIHTAGPSDLVKLDFF